MTVINTNTKALFAQNALSINNRTLTTAMQQLSTGNRINGAKDDAAGLAIGTRMSADLRGMSVAIRNANDGISLTQTAEGALGEVSNMLQRMRDLSAQAATGSLTSSNRKALQAELDQLVAEIDNVAKTTNFNGIQLLDGSTKAVSLQTGVREGEQVTVSIQSATSQALGLQGSRIEGEVTSGRIGALTSLATNDVLINGKNAIGTNITAQVTAQELAANINTNSGEHRVVASAFNTLKGVAPTSSVFASGALTVNGDSIGAASSVEELVSNINRDAAGVTAVLANDGTIELSNDTGANIVITGSDSTTAGFSAATYRGFVTLNSMDGGDIAIQAKSGANGYVGGTGTIADVKNMGFNESSDGVAFSGSAVASGAIAPDSDLRINGVRVGPSADGSASAKAAAINKLTAETGVTATARTEVELDYDVSNLSAAAEVTINGVVVDLQAETDIGGVLDAINAAGAGVLASTSAQGKLVLTSETGADIRYLDADEFLTGATTEQTAGGQITLTSSIGSDIRIESKSSGAAALIGFADQGGSSTAVGGALSITTQESAGRAISVIDAALDSVAMDRANLGAFQNRLTAAVDNLSSQSIHLAESKGRIMDTDYAKATTELARSQIVQQAATAMLAQANQQPSMVLSLLQ